MITRTLRAATLLSRSSAFNPIFRPVGMSVNYRLFKTQQKMESNPIEPLTPEDIEKQKILKQKRVLRRYLRLRRNNYVKMNFETLTDSYYVDHYLPKI